MKRIELDGLFKPFNLNVLSLRVLLSHSKELGYKPSWAAKSTVSVLMCSNLTFSSVMVNELPVLLRWTLSATHWTPAFLPFFLYHLSYHHTTHIFISSSKNNNLHSFLTSFHPFLSSLKLTFPKELFTLNLFPFSLCSLLKILISGLNLHKTLLELLLSRWTKNCRLL